MEEERERAKSRAFGPAQRARHVGFSTVILLAPEGSEEAVRHALEGLPPNDVPAGELLALLSTEAR